MIPAFIWNGQCFPDWREATRQVNGMEAIPLKGSGQETTTVTTRNDEVAAFGVCYPVLDLQLQPRYRSRSLHGAILSCLALWKKLQVPHILLKVSTTPWKVYKPPDCTGCGGAFGY